MDFNYSEENKKNSTLFMLFLGLIFLLPWPHGLELVWEYLLFGFIIFSLSTIHLIKTNNINNLSSILTPYKTSLILFLILILYALLQIVPLPQSVIKIISPNTLTSNSLSIAPETSLLELLKNMSYLATFILCLLLLSSKNRIITLLNILFFSSTVIAIYSLINHYTDGSFSLISSIPPWVMPWKQVTHGTFSYQNHYASFLTMTIPLGIGLISYYHNKGRAKGLKTPLMNQIIELVMSKNGLYLLAIFIMILSLLKTSSRGGNLIFIFSIFYTYICYLIVNKASTKKLVKRLSLSLLTFIILIMTLISTGTIDKLTKRYQNQGLTPNGRDIMVQTVTNIITDYPIFGTGTGTYPVIQHKYKSPLLGNTAMSKRAHNDYFEYLCNQGIIGFSLLMLAMALLYIKLFKQLKKTKSSFMGIKIACFTSVSAISIHSFIDFNFHLPANAIYFFIIFAAGLQAGQLSNKQRSRAEY
ncbi:O-antigen ligase family protein [Pseudocolwellia agarivorans]|uniref:O-antigen ligase family protein n=1 Tax=Pseudocolwellia agarivorans TaxID=1911682 RepID=UPI0009870ACC|nr:O-antigen ligase family protein [Pseudocolwellia agarivorans]